MFSHIFLAVIFLSTVCGWRQDLRRCFELPDGPKIHRGCEVADWIDGPNPHIGYTFNRKTGLCEEHYNVCLNTVGKNNFKTKKECESQCPVDRILNKCNLKHYGEDAKPCLSLDCTFPIGNGCDWKKNINFYFSKYTGLCEPDHMWYYRFKGCNKPTANSFPSKESCNHNCPKKKGYCYHPAPPSHCNQAQLTKPLFYYDQEIGKCKEDWAGCPSATKNRFKSYNECRRCGIRIGR